MNAVCWFFGHLIFFPNISIKCVETISTQICIFASATGRINFISTVNDMQTALKT